LRGENTPWRGIESYETRKKVLKRDKVLDTFKQARQARITCPQLSEAECLA